VTGFPGQVLGLDGELLTQRPPSGPKCSPLDWHLWFAPGFTETEPPRLAAHSQPSPSKPIIPTQIIPQLWVSYRRLGEFPAHSGMPPRAICAGPAIIQPMDRELFERLVARALDDLPSAFHEQMENVEIVVEDWPSPSVLRQAGVRRPTDLLGFYHGIPLTQRNRGYTLVLPDKISIYQRPLELRCRTLEELADLVQRVVRHEIAHHFGIDDDRLAELGAY